MASGTPPVWGRFRAGFGPVGSGNLARSKAGCVYEAIDDVFAIDAATVVAKLELEGLATSATMLNEVLEIDKASEMNPRLLEPPRRECLASLPPGEPEVLGIELPLLAFARHPSVKIEKQPPRRGGQIVKAPSEYVVRQPVGHGDVIECDLDVLDILGSDLRREDRPLVLPQQGDGLDEMQVLLVIPPRPRAIIDEPKLGSERVDDHERLQESLGIVM